MAVTTFAADVRIAWISAAAAAIRCSSQAVDRQILVIVVVLAIVRAPVAVAPLIVQARVVAALQIDRGLAAVAYNGRVLVSGQARVSDPRAVAAKAAETPSGISSPVKQPICSLHADTPAWAVVAAVAARALAAAVVVVPVPEAAAVVVAAAVAVADGDPISR